MNTTPKYKLTDETIKFIKKTHGIITSIITLHRIEALRDFGNIKAGDKGGFVQSEDNLSHQGDCWIYHDAKVYDNAKVYGNALIDAGAQVFDNAKVYDDVFVGDCAQVYNNATVYGNAQVLDNAKVFHQAIVCGNAKVHGNAKIASQASVYGNAQVYGNAFLYNFAHVHGNARIYGDAYVDCDEVTDNTRMYKGFYISDCTLKDLKNNNIIYATRLVNNNGKSYNGFLRLRNGKLEDISVEQFEAIKRIKQEQSKKQDTLKPPAENQNEVKQNKPKRGFKI